MADAVCYTAVFGQYDELTPAPGLGGCRFVAFTDDPAMTAEGWEMRVQRPPTHAHSRMAAKWYKLHPHVLFPEASGTVWIDGAHRILSPSGPLHALEYARDVGIAVHRHPRDCVYEEAEASKAFPDKYGDQPLDEQCAAYRKEGHPTHWGLWACGTIASVRGARVDAMFEDWWGECRMWSYQDQVSFPVVLRRAGIRPGEFPYNQYQSPWFQVGGHLRSD